MRTCTRCRQEQPLDQFPVRKDTSKHYWQCKSCRTKIATKWNRENVVRRLVVHARTRAKQFGLACDINYQWVLDHIRPKCPCCEREYYLGLAPAEMDGRSAEIRELRPSLDQFNPREGYTRENTRIVCFGCNRVKNSGSAELHDKLSRWIRLGGPFDAIDDEIRVYTLAEYAAKS